jgi:hypothetical protein
LNKQGVSEGGQERHDAGGAVDREVGGRCHFRHLRARAGDDAAGDAFGAELAERGEGPQVPEVVAGEQHRARRPFRGQGPQRGPLVHTGRAQLKHEPAGLDGQRRVGGQPLKRVPQQLERRRRVRRPPGVHGERRALVLHRRTLGGASGRQEGRQCLADDLNAGRGGRRGEHACLPALRAVVAEHDQTGHVGEAAERYHVGRGPARDDRGRADPVGQSLECRDGTGRGDGQHRVGHDRGEGAVIVGGDERARRVCDQRGEACLAFRGSGLRQAQWQGHR